jgi:hypothetical protein
LIRANFGVDTGSLGDLEFAKLYNEALWIESYRLRNLADLLAAMFGAKH